MKKMQKQPLIKHINDKYKSLPARRQAPGPESGGHGVLQQVQRQSARRLLPMVLQCRSSSPLYRVAGVDRDAQCELVVVTFVASADYRTLPIGDRDAVLVSEDDAAAAADPSQRK